MRLPNTAHTSRPWRIHELTRDFRLEDVWALPTPGGPDDFPRLVQLIASGDPSQSSSGAVRTLFAIPVEGRGAARMGRPGLRRRLQGANAARPVAGGSARRPIRPGLRRAPLHLALPDRVRALVLLEPDVSRELAPAAAEWVDAVVDRLRRVAARDGVDAVAEALIDEVAGEDAWRSFPDEVRRMLAGNGPALLAELAGEWWLDADAAALATIEQPALLVMAADSPPEFHQAPEALAEALPNARLSRVGGGHLIDPASPEVIAFIEEVLESR